MHYQIREAATSDIQQMHQVRLSVKENILMNKDLVKAEHYKSHILTTGKTWVAEVNNQIVGFAAVNIQEENVWALFIHPEHEKKGLGKKLHTAMLDWYFKQGKEYICLTTDPETRAAGFYKKLNWKESEKCPDGEIKMELTLKTYKGVKYK